MLIRFYEYCFQYREESSYPEKYEWEGNAQAVLLLLISVLGMNLPRIKLFKHFSKNLENSQMFYLLYMLLLYFVKFV